MKAIHVAIFAAGSFLLGTVPGWATFCGNGAAGGPSDPPKCTNLIPDTTPETGSTCGEPFDAWTGNDTRRVRDLAVSGAVGGQKLEWTRFTNSRFTGSRQVLGQGSSARHNYQWEMAPSGTNVSGQVQMNVYYPDGKVVLFTRVTSTTWQGPASISDVIFQDGNLFTLQTAVGWRYQFEKITPSQGDPYYLMQRSLDSQGNVQTMAYNEARQLTRVTEPGGRYLQVAYQELPTSVTFTNLATVSSVPPSNQWVEVTLSNTNAYRYLRFRASPSAIASVAEVQFIRKGTKVPFPGTVFASPGSSGALATDGNVGTWYESSATGGFVGIDLGTGYRATIITKIRYYARPGYEGLMLGGVFEASNVYTPPVTVISQVTGSDGRSVAYEYQAIDDSAAQTRFQVLSAANYADGTRATYEHAQVVTAARPLLIAAVDPRYTQAFNKIRNEYDTGKGVALGMIKRQVDHSTGGTLASLEPYPGNVNMPQAAYAGGVKEVFLMNGKNGRIATKIDRVGSKTAFTYTASNAGFLSTTKDALNRVVTRVPSPFNNPLQITHADGAQESVTRDSLDLPETVTDALGRTTVFQRDASHRVTRITYADSTYETFTYNDLGKVLTHRLRNGGTESNTWDSRGLQLTHTDPLGNVTTYGHDNLDRVSATTDARGNTTRYEYNDRGNLTKITYPDNTFQAFTYDSFGNKITETNERGKTWTYVYDAYHRVLSMTDPLNRMWRYEYDDPYMNNVARSIAPSGKVTAFTYDAEWRKTGETLGAGTAEAATTSYAYDAVGNLIRVTDPLGHVTTHAYDKRNRRISTTDALGNKTAWAYDAVGNMLTVTRPYSTVTTNVYDSMNRLTRTTDPKGQVTQMAYDASGNLTQMTDAKGNIYRFEYDLLNRRTAMVYPDNTREQYAYDAAGNMVTYTTRAGQVRTGTFDSRNREIAVAWSDATPAVGRAYDPAGRLTLLTNSVSALSYAYDDANQLLSETQTVAGQPARTVQYTYDADGLRSSMTQPNGAVIGYAWTARNQLASVSADGPPPVATYTYDAAGNRLTKTLENGTSATYTYDVANRMTSLVHKKGGTAFASFAQGYDNVNRKKYVKREDGKGDVYAYDKTDQLTQVRYDATNPDGTPTGAQRTVAYTYDSVGNRQRVAVSGVSNTAYTANNLNQYTLVGTDVPAYDANGNTVLMRGWTYTYDAQNRLTSAHNISTTVAFAYDAKNRCVKRVVNGVATYLTYDGWNLIEERDASGAEQARYVHGAAVDEMLVRVTTSGAIYLQQDGLGSSSHLTDENGNVVERYSYDVFGAVTIRDSSFQLRSSSAHGNRFLFTGREWLAEVGLYDYRNRVYSAELGRFLQTDPIRFDAQDWNIYRYCGNSPLNGIDPLGLRKPNFGQLGKGVAALAGAVIGTVGLAYAEVGSGGLATAGVVLASGTVAAGYAYGIGNIVAAFSSDEQSAKTMEGWPSSVPQVAGRVAAGENGQKSVEIIEGGIDMSKAKGTLETIKSILEFIDTINDLPRSEDSNPKDGGVRDRAGGTGTKSSSDSADNKPCR